MHFCLHPVFCKLFCILLELLTSPITQQLTSGSSGTRVAWLFLPKLFQLPTNAKGERTRTCCSGELPSSQQNLTRAPEFHISRCWAGGWPLSATFKWFRAQKSLKEERYKSNPALHSPQHYITPQTFNWKVSKQTPFSSF